jgi:hypothetical protein
VPNVPDEPVFLIEGPDWVARRPPYYDWSRAVRIQIGGETVYDVGVFETIGHALQFCLDEFGPGNFQWFVLDNEGNPL